MNGINVNRKKVSMGFAWGRRYAEDRDPNTDEIQRLIEFPDRRLRAIVLTMVSSGTRLGTWADLKKTHFAN